MIFLHLLTLLVSIALGSGLTFYQKSKILTCHNEIRSQVAKKGFKWDPKDTAKNMMKVEWNDELEDSALKYRLSGRDSADNWDGITVFYAEKNRDELEDQEIIDEWCRKSERQIFGKPWEEDWTTGNMGKMNELYDSLQVIHWNVSKIGCVIEVEKRALVCVYNDVLMKGERLYQSGKTCGNCGEGRECEDGLCALNEVHSKLDRGELVNPFSKNFRRDNGAAMDDDDADTDWRDYMYDEVANPSTEKPVDDDYEEYEDIQIVQTTRKPVDVTDYSKKSEDSVVFSSLEDQEKKKRLETNEVAKL